MWNYSPTRPWTYVIGIVVGKIYRGRGSTQSAISFASAGLSGCVSLSTVAHSDESGRVVSLHWISWSAECILCSGTM